jgi:hypothetical protein
LGQLAPRLGAAGGVRGAVTVVDAGAAPGSIGSPEATDAEDAPGAERMAAARARVAALVASGLSRAAAAKQVARETGVPRRELYAADEA